MIILYCNRRSSEWPVHQYQLKEEKQFIFITLQNKNFFILNVFSFLYLDTFLQIINYKLHKLEISA